MKRNVLKTGISLIGLSIVLLNGCSKENEAVAPQAKQTVQPGSSNRLSAEQIANMQSIADKMAREELTKIKSGANQRAVTSTDMIGLNVNSVSSNGASGATYSFTAFIQSYAAISPSIQTTYTYLFCAAASHMRYAVFYIYNGYSHNMVSKGSLTGSTGGCLTGSLTFTESFGGPNTSYMYVVIFDVLNAPPGGSTQIAQVSSNQRDLYYPGLSVYNHYWE